MNKKAKGAKAASNPDGPPTRPLHVNTPLHRRVKKLAQSRDKNIKDLAEELIEEALKATGAKS